MNYVIFVVAIRMINCCLNLQTPSEYPIAEVDIDVMPTEFYTYNVWFFPAYFCDILQNSAEQQNKGSYLINIDYNTASQPVLFHYVELSQDQSQIIHRIIIIQENEIYEHKLEVAANTYEWRWMLFILTVDPINLKTQVLLQGQPELNYVVFDFDIYGQISIHQQFGGVAQISLANNNVNYDYNLLSFRGKIYYSEISSNPWIADIELVSFYDICKSDDSIFQDLLVLQAWSFSKTSQVIEYSQNQFSAAPIYMVGWLKINQQSQSPTWMTAIDIQGANPYEPEIKLPFIKIQYQIENSDDNIILITFTEFQNPFQSYGKLQTKQISVTNNIFEWHFIKIIIQRDQIQLQLTFIDSDITEEYQIQQFHINHAYIHLGGDFGQWFDGQIAQLHFGKCLDCDINAYKCHASCDTCIGPFYYSCTSCRSNSFREYDPITHRCQCQIGTIDSNGLSCEQYFDSTIETIITTVDSMEWFEDKVYGCEFGYYLFDEKCFQCPSVIRQDYITCIECLQNSNKWILNPQCITDLYRSKETLQFTSTKRTIIVKIMQLQTLTIPNTYYWMNNELIEIKFVQNICRMDPLTSTYQDNCLLTSKTHMGYPLYIQCVDFASFRNDECILSPKYIYVESQNKCGKHCQSCSNDRCNVCANEIKYFLSINGVDCLECTIPNCKYCFHFKTTNHNIQSLQYKFQQQNIDETISTGCSKCYDGYSYNFQTELCELEIDLLPNCLAQYRDGDRNCLLTNTDNFEYGASSIKCSSYVLYCSICLKRQSKVSCLKCNKGYYSEYGSGICKTNTNLFREGSRDITLQNLILKNGWMWEIQAFYYLFIPGNNLYRGSGYSFQQEFIVLCDLNYYNSGSICQECPKECSKCDSKGCIECQQDQYIKYTLIQNKCIQCQMFCEACLPRSEAEIKEYNPRFDFTSNQSTRCLVPQKQTQSISFYLDNSIGVVRICQKYLKCSLTMVSEIKDTQLAHTYMNVNGVDSTQYSVAEEFRINVFGLKNPKKILDSFFEYLATYSQDFIEFTLQNFRQELTRSNVYDINTQEQYNLIFQNVQLISRQEFNIQFVISQCKLFKIQSLTLDSFYSNDIFKFKFDTTKAKAIIFEIDTLIIINSVFYNMTFIDLFMSGANFTIQNIQIRNSKFTNTILFKQVYLLSNQYIRFEKILITNCTFENSSLIYSDSLFTIMKQFEFHNLTLVNSRLIKIQQFSLDNISLTNISIQNSNILWSEQEFEVMQNKQLSITMLSMINCRILTISSQSSLFSVKWQLDSLSLSDILISDNYCENCKKDEENDLQNFEYLILIQAKQVQAKNIRIFKIFGLTEIFIQNAEQTTLLNLSIYSKAQQNIITQHIECLDLQAGLITNSVIRLSNIQNINIQHCLIQDNVMINSPIIYIALDTSVLNDQTVSITDSIIKNNILVQSNQLAFISTIYIQSQVRQLVVFQNVEFNTNWLNVYQEGSTQDQSATVIRVASPLSNVILLNIQFRNIMITNSTQSNMHISASQITIKNSIFTQINTFEWQVYSKFIVWGFNQNEQIYYEQLSKIYGIQSLGGIAFLQFTNLIVENTIIEETIAAQAGCFYLLARKISQIQFVNNTISNSRTVYIGLNSIAGSLVIESKQQELYIYYSNNSVQSSSSYYEGGFAKIYPALVSNQFLFMDSLFQDIYSLTNVFTMCDFELNLKSNNLTLDNITIINSVLGFQEYLSKISLLTTSQLVNSEKSRTIIAVYGGLVILNNCRFTNIEMWGILQIQKGGVIILQNVIISNCKFWNTPLIYILLSDQSSNSKIAILGVNVLEVKRMVEPNYQCKQTNTIQQSNSYCKLTQQSPQYIQFQFDDEYYNNQMMCNTALIFKAGNSIDSLLQIEHLQKSHSIQILNSLFHNINCSDCQLGLLKIAGVDKFLVDIHETILQKNECGNIGCFTIIGDQLNDTRPLTNLTQEQQQQSQLRILQTKDESSVKLSNMLMSHNQANYGSCLMMYAILAKIDGLICINSIAAISSAVHFFADKQSALTLYNSSFFNNMCQLGEMYFNGQCLPCDSNLNQYSVNPNKNLCEIKNSITTSEITAATINLKQGYWRYTYKSDEILQCVNNQDNCKGGWISGEQSCEVGHLGCLCESCDLYDVRGSGSYFNSDSFSCQKCSDQNLSSVIITLITTLIVLGTTLITVNSQFTINTQIQELKQQTNQYKLVHRLTQDQSGALTKLMMNFFLVIGSILTTVREIPQSTVLLFQVGSSSSEIIAYSYDCAFNEVSIDILYMRLIWQVILPFLQFGVILILYIIILRYKFAEAKSIVITTTLIYLSILSQPNIIKEAVSLLSYRNISNEKWILRNVAYVYGTHTHIIFMIFLILPILGIFGILWPGTLFYILFKNRKTQYEKKTRYLIGYLYNEYNSRSYYWEIVRIIYKALILTVAAFFQDYQTLRYCSTQLIIFVYLILLRQQQPYNQQKLNKLESRMLMGQMSIILIAQAILSIDINDFSALATILFLILVLIVAYVLYQIFREIVAIILKKFQVQIDQLRFLILKWFPQAVESQSLQKLLTSQQQQQQLIIDRFQRIRRYLIQQVRIQNQEKSNRKQV